MSVKTPKFAESPYFIAEDNNWHITDDAPKEVMDEFDEFNEYYDEMYKQGVIV